MVGFLANPRQAIAPGIGTEAARGVREDVIVLCLGGPIATAEDASHILGRCPDCHGFYGASSMERLPTEVALTAQTRRFKAIRRG